MPTLHDFTATTLTGEEQSLDAWRGKVVLVVNTSSHCGLTPQFEGLEKLPQQYADRGRAVLGFPCNQLHGQEPRDSEQLSAFCQIGRASRRTIVCLYV